MTSVGRILGTGSGMPVLNRSHSALYLQIKEHNILFDCGEGTAQKLLEYELDKDVIDSIIISHFHPDHSSGIFMVIQMFHLQGRSRTLTLYLPERTAFFRELMNSFYLFPERFSFQIVMKDVADLKLDIPDVVPISNKHLMNYAEFIEEKGLPNEMTSYSFFISIDDRRLLFTSDILSTEHLKDYIDMADVIVVDALHPPIDDILNILDRQSKQVILIHGIAKDLYQVIEDRYIKSTGDSLESIFPEDGYEINL